MVGDKYAVRLQPEQREEREELQHLIQVGKSSARVTVRARILLKSDDGWAAPRVAEPLDVALGTVYQIKQRFAGEGLAGVLWDRRQANRHRRLDDRGEAHLVALASSPAPEGHDHWTLRLLAGKVVELGLAASMSHEGVRKRLKKNALKPPFCNGAGSGRRRSGASPRWAPSSWPTWRTCWTYTPNPMTPRGRWSASTRPPPSCWRRRGRRCRPSPDCRCGRTRSTGGRGPATCSWLVSR